MHRCPHHISDLARFSQDKTCFSFKLLSEVSLSTIPSQTMRTPPSKSKQMARARRPHVRTTTVLAILTTIWLLFYYLNGQTNLPEAILLPIAGQVLSVGVHSFSTIIFTLLIRYTSRRALPVDAIMPFLINLDTQLGGALTPERLLIAPIVTLLFLHTPETLLGALAAGKPDIRSLGPVDQRVELGPFGGAFDKDAYFLSGQILLSGNDPDLAYQRVAYRTDLGWVLPRKPTLWYQEFAKNLGRNDDAEKRITVPVNEAAVLVPVPSLPAECGKRNISDFGYWLTMHHCGAYIGFSFGGGNLPAGEGFYELHRGEVSAEYASWKNERFVRGSEPKNLVPVTFPRVDDLWKHMKMCFLNSISFNRPPSKMRLTERLMLSAVVRIAGIDDKTGFSTPPAMADAIVRDVVTSNLSRWVLVTMVFAVAIDIVRVALSIYNFEVLAPELEPLVASLRDVRGLKPTGRYARGKTAWFRRLCGWFERYEGGGGRWIITKGIDDDVDDDDNDAKSTTSTVVETGTDRTSSATV